MTSFSEESIIKYFEKDCSPGEEDGLLTWLELSEENKIVFLTLKKIYTLKKIHYYADPRQLDIALSKFNQRVQQTQKSKNRKYFLQVIKYAASIALVLGLTFTFIWISTRKNANNSTIITTEVAKCSPVKFIKLPDSTKIWLNSGSILHYPATFSGKERKIWLEGEAYLEVKTDTLHPFVVQADSLMVRVYGTAFNVEVNPNKRTIRTTLVHGRVAVQNLKGDKIASLHPSQMATFYKQSQKIELETVNTNLYTSWRYGFIMLEKANVNEIAEKLEDVYHVRIVINSKYQMNNKFNFVFRRDQNVDTVMEMLRFVSQIRYKIIGQEIYINQK
jgi:transmembrane sensor